MEKHKVFKIAQELGILQHNLTSDMRSLIQLIQKTQGNKPCYKTDLRYSCKSNCDWNKSCKKLTASWLR